MAKFRNYSVVLHDVQKGSVSKNDIFEWSKIIFRPKYMVVAEEAYNHQEGSHIHLFFEMNTQRAFKKTLNDLMIKWPHGRVQLDKGRGKIYQQCAYLIDPTVKMPTKDKHTDPTPLFWPRPEIQHVPGQRALQALAELVQELEQRDPGKPAWIPSPKDRTAQAFFQQLLH